MLHRRHFLFAVPGVLLAVHGGVARSKATRRPRPGDPLRLVGTLRSRDEGTPLAGYTIDVYQTDADGYYARPENDSRQARLRARMTTDERGRYALTTIVPGHYPGRESPKHIHVHLWGPGVPEHWIDDFRFAGDPYLSDEDLARAEGAGYASPIVELARDRAGRWRGRRDLILDPELAEANQLVDPSYRRSEIQR